MRRTLALLGIIVLLVVAYVMMSNGFGKPTGWGPLLGFNMLFALATFVLMALYHTVRAMRSNTDGSIEVYILLQGGIIFGIAAACTLAGLLDGRYASARFFSAYFTAGLPILFALIRGSRV